MAPLRTRVPQDCERAAHHPALSVPISEMGTSPCTLLSGCKN